ncbi:type iii secretion system substrate exporter [Lucifera butyrica]|uniref:Type iii secretion system substrate exporter n=1 Tax=Lucifera butyrica TaxID=1351585 RepID=A0A498R5W3_9FIRM|nr:EscU/YscU/HrcU family type III secretion system export apparatus switch protein [Lucifera butyrica]VBB05632.1 type iii secretion system substrate exporter [Lucifera butyrica]
MENPKSNNETKQAIALHYNPERQNAPRVVAKGTGLIAENILNIAKQSAVPVYQNKTVAGMLMAVELDREIPAALYQVVAEVLAYVYRLDQEAGKRRIRR